MPRHIPLIEKANKETLNVQKEEKTATLLAQSFKSDTALAGSFLRRLAQQHVFVPGGNLHSDGDLAQRLAFP